MSQTFLRRSDQGVPLRALRSEFIPINVETSPYHHGVVYFSNGSTSPASCLHCPTAPCMEYKDSEVVSLSLPRFPADRNSVVCPSGAITRLNAGAPIISEKSCILCGICASRCPVGAIRMMPHAVVDDTLMYAFPETNDVTQTEKSITAFSNVSRSGDFLTETDTVVDQLRSQLINAWIRIGDRFPDHLARNLLIAAGAGSAMRRKGDNAARMDIVMGPPWPQYGCAEAEFGDLAILDAPRDLMDDVAVFVGRFGIEKASILPLVITDVLPNWRSEYWRIVKDVQEVLGLKIGTVTVLALCLLIWHRKKISDLPRDFFHVHVETESYRQAVLEPLLGRKLKINFDSRSSVEVVK